MRILLYQGGSGLVRRSGVGHAMEHQRRALESAGVPFTLDPKEEYDAVLLNTVFPDSLWMGLRAGAAGKRVIWYGHSTREDFRNSFPGSNRLSGLFGRWNRRCLSCADLVITPTPYSERLLEKEGIGAPVTVLSNGIDLETFVRREEGGKRFRRRFGFSPQQKIVLCVGHYMERKGILDFVEAARSFPQYAFVWLGYTPPALVTKQVKRALGAGLSNLFFPGYADGQELLDAYSGSDLFFFPTQKATEGIVMLEAMAMRLPVLVRDIPVYEGWLEHGKQVYKGKNREEFEELLAGILEGKLADLTEEAHRAAEKNSIIRIGSALSQICEKLENRGRAYGKAEDPDYNRLV